MKTRIIGCTLAALILSACASTDEPAGTRVPAHERADAPTGSNIRTRPQQGPSELRTMSREGVERNVDGGVVSAPKER